MADPAFDTLEAAHRLGAGGIRAEQADAIVDVVKQSTGQMVTLDRFEAAVERFDTAIAGLHARIDSIHSELSARIDSVRSDLRAEFARSQVRTLIAVIAANALMVTIIGLLLSGVAPITLTFGTP